MYQRSEPGIIGYIIAAYILVMWWLITMIIAGLVILVWVCYDAWKQRHKAKAKVPDRIQTYSDRR